MKLIISLLCLQLLAIAHAFGVNFQAEVGAIISHESTANAYSVAPMPGSAPFTTFSLQTLRSGPSVTERRGVLEFDLADIAALGSITGATLEFSWRYIPTSGGFGFGGSGYVYGFTDGGTVEAGDFGSAPQLLQTLTQASSNGPDTPFNFVSIDVTTLVNSALASPDSHLAMTFAISPDPSTRPVGEFQNVVLKAVPEPTGAMLLAFGGGFLLLRRCAR